MENMLKILDDQEQLMASDVEKVFTSLANIPKGSDWARYTLEAQKQIQVESVENAIKLLRGYRNKYIEECEKAIANTKMTVSAPQIVDSYSLMSNKYKLISQPLEKQIEVLGNMTNQNDFEIMKGMILERLTDQVQINQVMKVELPTEEKLKKQAIGQLKFRTANIDWIPSVKLNRAVSIQGLGLRNYLNSFFQEVGNMKKDIKDKRLEVRVSKKDIEKLEQLANKYNMTKSALIRKLIHETGQEVAKMEFVKDSDYIAIRNLKQILATNEKLAKEIREGTVTPSQGKAILSCSNANIKAIQLLDLEKRITQIEEMLDIEDED